MSGAHVTVAGGQWDAFLAALKETPRIGGVAIKETCAPPSAKQPHAASDSSR